MVRGVITVDVYGRHNVRLSSRALSHREQRKGTGKLKQYLQLILEDGPFGGLRTYGHDVLDADTGSD